MRLTHQEIEVINRAIEYVNQNFYQSISADDLSVKFKIASKKLQFGFIKYTGKTLHPYILRVRLEHSKFLLSNPDKPIKAIHKQIGYKSRSHFGQFFKQQTGITPNEYRSQFYL